MQYHDFTLIGYSVLECGLRVVLHLQRTTGKETSFSDIEFLGVAAYRFDHTDTAIITEILEGTVDSFIVSEKMWIETAARTNGLRYWTGDLHSFLTVLQTKGLRSWTIDSAIGFTGKIVAETMRKKAAQPGATDNPGDAQRLREDH